MIQLCVRDVFTGTLMTQLRISDFHMHAGIGGTRSVASVFFHGHDGAWPSSDYAVRLEDEQGLIAIRPYLLS
jgi:hypothetical protein